MLTFSVDHIRPIGQRYPGATITVYFEWIEWFEVFMTIAYAIKEVIVLVKLIFDYQKELKIIKSVGAQDDVTRKETILRGSHQ